MISRNHLVLLIVSSSVFFEALDIAIVNLAIPLIQREFTLPADTVQWMQTLYVLFYGGFLIVGGKLADVIGRRKVFLTGSTIFLITSFGAGIATSFEMLTAFRAFQGLGAALVMPSALSIVTNTFTETHARHKAIGVFGSFAAVGSGSGLSLGGIIATYMGWQWIFFINVPVILVTIVLGFIYIPPDETSDAKKPDILAGVLLTLAILMLTNVIHDLKNVSQAYPIHLAMVAAIVICLTIFIRRTRQSGNPLIDFNILRHPRTLTGNILFITLGAFFTSYLFILSLVLQSQMHYSSAKAGVLLVPFSLLSAIVSRTFLPFMLRRITIIRGAMIGMLLMFSGALLLFTGVLLDYYLPLILFSAACVTGMGIAVCFNCLIVISMERIPDRDHGIGSSLANTSYFFGGGLGLSLVGLAMQFDTVYLPIVVLGAYAMCGVACLVVYSMRSKRHDKAMGYV